MRKAAQQTWFAPAVAGLIEIYSRSFTRQVDYVVGSGSIYICDTNTRVLKLIGIIKPGRVIHGDFGAESTVAKVGPVADLAVANPPVDLTPTERRRAELRDRLIAAAGRVMREQGLSAVRARDLA